MKPYGDLHWVLSVFPLYYPRMALTAALIFLGTYALLSFEQNIPGMHIGRSAAALLGAVAMVASGVVNLEQSYRLVDMNTIVFLLGMMIVVSYLEISGFFAEVEILLIKRAGSTRQLLALVIASSGTLSALFMNDAVCLMLTPVLVRLASRARLSLKPYLIALALSANIGSAMTPMGNPQNMIVALRSGIPFGRFVLAIAPISLLGLVGCHLALTRLYPAEFARGRSVGIHEPLPPLVRGRLLYACLGGAGLMLLLFAMNVSPPLAAISTAALLILAGARKPREAFRRVDWDMLLMFAALFVVMGGLRRSGLVDGMLAGGGKLSAAPLGARLAWIAAASAVLSNLVSNVPGVIFLSGFLPRLGGQPALWLALSMSATLAGNMTILGSVANLIVFESAKGSVRVGFWEYFKAGAPLTVLLIAAGTLYLSVVFR